MIKKYFYFLLLPLLLFTVSCDNREDKDTISTVYELRNVNFVYDSAKEYYKISREFTTPLYDGDVVLIYRMSGITTNNSPIWQQIPVTLYLNEGELDYGFDFSKYDILIKAGGNYDLSTTSTYLNEQIFRVIIVPGSAMGTTKINYSDYYTVINHFNLQNATITSL